MNEHASLTKPNNIFLHINKNVFQWNCAIIYWYAFNVKNVCKRFTLPWHCLKHNSLNFQAQNGRNIHFFAHRSTFFLQSVVLMCVAFLCTISCMNRFDFAINFSSFAYSFLANLAIDCSRCFLSMSFWLQVNLKTKRNEIKLHCNASNKPQSFTKRPQIYT